MTTTLPPPPLATAATADTTPVVDVQSVSKAYGRDEARVLALDQVSLAVERGRFTAIMGPSGSGKSTLLHCLAGLDGVDDGHVMLGDVDLTRLGDDALTRLRRDRIGFVFQSFNLIGVLTAQENILLPLILAGRRPDPAWFDHVMDTLGLRERLRHRPGELSGGQQQRVACARAMITRPDIVVADEPTGNLDSRSGAQVLQFLRTSATDLGQSVVMVTHDPSAAAYADRVVFLADGRLVAEIVHPSAELVLDQMLRLGS